MDPTEDDYKKMKALYGLVSYLKGRPFSAKLKFDLMTFQKALDRDLYGEKL